MLIEFRSRQNESDSCPPIFLGAVSAGLIADALLKHIDTAGILTDGLCPASQLKNHGNLISEVHFLTKIDL